MKNSTTLLALALLLFYSDLISQRTITLPFTIDWSDANSFKFEGSTSVNGYSGLPAYSRRFAIQGKSLLDITVRVQDSDTIAINEIVHDDLHDKWITGSGMVEERGQWSASVWLIPLQNTGDNKVVRIRKGELVIRVTPDVNAGQYRNGPEFKIESVLKTGQVHRVAVEKAGVYKIDYSFIKDKLKIDPSTIDPARIGVFGNGGGRIPQWNNAPRVDDLEQTPTLGVGLEDGQFNQGDYLIWYAEGPDKWIYDAAGRHYNMDLNIYDRLNHYYVIIGGPARLSLASRTNGSSWTYTSSSTLEYQRVEDELVNLLGRYRPPGSGQEWYGDEMALIKELDYTNKFKLVDQIPTDTMLYKLKFAARSGQLSRFYLRINNTEVGRNIGGVNLSSYEANFANDATLQGALIPGQTVDDIVIRYPDANGSDSRGWVDFLQFNYWKQNKYRPQQPLFIRDIRAQQKVTQYAITDAPAGCQVWDITDPLHPIGQQYTIGANLNFVVETDSLVPMEFICFNPSTDAPTPMYEAHVVNQDIHGLQQADLVILYYDEFSEAAQKLAAHRRSHSGLEVAVYPVSQVCEEFGGGSRDPSALRDFARMMYQRDPGFKYLCFIGDASYDYLNHFSELPYQNFVPAFETEESLDPIRSFPADDFFSLLDDDEGDNLIGALDIAVGRLPVSSADEAIRIVNKIIYYDNEPVTLNDWRNRAVMVADDEDGNIHLNQADGLAVKNSLEHPVLNLQKVYLDAFPQESTPGGDRYPDVNDAIDLNMTKGALTVTYLGHGGPNGWSQERVLGINQAQSYQNINNMPLYITATCSFAGYDEPGFVSTGEHLLLNSEGGAIALMTTVRAVYSGSNERLTRAVLDILYSPDEPGEYPSIGEVLRRAKNTNGLDTLDTNARKFTLLGDPSQLLAIPEFDVQVTDINGHVVGAGMVDTLSALEKTVISGIILGHDSTKLTSFNGQIIVTLFDKIQLRKTLANDESSYEKPFTTQIRQLFKGTATVTAGDWSIEFVLPKDIDFSYGPGKLSFYAENDETDASGYYSGFIVGGVREGGINDDQPPVVDLFMNDDNFRSGGITDHQPDIFIKLSDDNGINVSGVSIGHDLEAILDGDDKNSIILNDFYQASLDDYRRGTVRYPLNGLAPGRHTLKVIAWDLANNSGEDYLEFYVLEGEGATIKNLGNYPNPMEDITYFQFEHNRPAVPMDIEINIFDVSGREINTIKYKDYVSDGYRVDDLEWDGRNNHGGDVAYGLYVYRLKVVFKNNGLEETVIPDGGKIVMFR